MTGADLALGIEIVIVFHGIEKGEFLLLFFRRFFADQRVGPRAVLALAQNLLPHERPLFDFVVRLVADSHSNDTVVGDHGGQDLCRLPSFDLQDFVFLDGE